MGFVNDPSINTRFSFDFRFHREMKDLFEVDKNRMRYERAHPIRDNAFNNLYESEYILSSLLK